jgi:hypothetical protein
MTRGWFQLVGAVLVAVGVALLAFLFRDTALVPLATVPYALATFGALAGASAFTARDRMFWAWMAIAVGYAFAGLTCLLTGHPPLKTPYGPAPFTATSSTVLMVKVIVVNVFSVIGIVLLAQAWRGLAPRLGGYRVATAVAFGIGALVAGPSVVDACRAIAAGHMSGLNALISGGGDLIGLTMIGPLAVTAIKMRGGAMMWTYALLTLSSLAWLLYDANAALSGNAQMIGDLMTASLGLTLSGAAGLAHRRALRT